VGTGDSQETLRPEQRGRRSEGGSLAKTLQKKNGKGGLKRNVHDSEARSSATACTSDIITGKSGNVYVEGKSATCQRIRRKLM